jgi:HEAT repeat protein
VQEQHQRIFTYYLTHYANQWLNCDYYGLSFIIQHVLAAELQAADLDATLNKIFTSEFMEARLQQFGWHMPLVQDLQRIATVDPELTTRLCLQLIAGERPNSLVLQKVLHLLEQLRNQLGQLGRSDSVAETEMDHIILALGHPPETAVTELSDLFHATSNPRIQSLIALALGETGSSLAVPFLMTIILDRTMNYPGEVKWAAADGLIALGDRTIASDLIRWFDETDWPSDKERIIYILGRLKAKEAQALIPKGLNSSNTKIVGRSLDLMWLLPCKQEYEPFLLQKLIQIQQPNALNESDPWSNEWVQKRLVAALGRIGSCGTQTKLEEFREQVAQRPEPVADKLKQHQRHQLKKAIEQAIQEMERRCH